MNIFDEFQSQFNKERANNAQYYAFSLALDAANWPGFAAWMRKAADEEMGHADKFAGYLVDRNQVPVLEILNAPRQMDGENPLPFFAAALQLERENTQSINALHASADEGMDPQSCTFLIWAIEEQTRSERELVDATLELKRVGPDGLLLLDREYGEKARGE